MTSAQIASKFDLLSERLNLRRHIVGALSKKGNSKQATEKADFFLTSTRNEIISDLESWFRSNPAMSRGEPQDVDQTLLLELVLRINGELAKMNVVVIPMEG